MPPGEAAWRLKSRMRWSTLSIVGGAIKLAFIAFINGLEPYLIPQ